MGDVAVYIIAIVGIRKSTGKNISRHVEVLFLLLLRLHLANYIRTLFAALIRSATSTLPNTTLHCYSLCGRDPPGTSTTCSNSTCSSVKELRYWQCMSEDAVCRLVVAARTARADCMVQSTTTAGTTNGKDGYVHL